MSEHEAGLAAVIAEHYNHHPVALAQALLYSPAMRDLLAEAWDEGHRLAEPHSDACEPTCPNPYREQS